MKVMIVGAGGTIGRAIVENLQKDHEIIRVGRNHGDIQADLRDDASVQRLFEQSGQVDAIIAAMGGVHFGPLKEMTCEQVNSSLQDKLMGQIRLVLTGQHFLNAGGSITLTTGIMAQQLVRDALNATVVNNALEGFVVAAANELRDRRINAISPTVLKEALESYGDYFPGFESVPASRVAQAYRRSLEGVETGKVYRIW